ncbi:MULTISPECIES: hypothetical protein [unclassified Halorubrum]|uniref:hypothetical protein n=1 Tax=unclassified Halorubrum TaxID=2642239 RepID=UPI0010F70142|nr:MULTISPECIES: hypothetical protein [unclassified Halorubrum]TKX44687.1 hypothetical protein EXE50_06555 [Halorubrum sp. ARQ200]TKX48697.1 hypothetical protein EXE49_15600 [Halorubrum sp. ASP121]
MEQPRRNVLAGLGAAASLAGCLSVDGVRYPDEIESSDESNTTLEAGTDESPTDNSTDTDGYASDLIQRIAERTQAIVADVVWFAISYPRAVESYNQAVDSVIETIDTVRTTIHQPTMPTAEMVDRLETVGYNAADRAETAFEPHFSPGGLLRSRTDMHIPALARAARRNDADRFVEELGRMRLSFFQIQTPVYVSKRFSRDPIHNRLLDRLVPRATGDVLVEVAVPTRRGFTTLAHEPYADEDGSYPPTFTADPLPAARRDRLRKRLGPVVQSSERTEEVFLTFTSRPDPVTRQQNAFRGPPSDLDGTPLYVQQYGDPERAREQLSDILTAGATEGMASITSDVTPGTDSVEWHRYYHREAGSDRTNLDEFPGVQYGYLLQAGPFIFATGFSGDAWEERPRWQGQLTESWLFQDAEQPT